MESRRIFRADLPVRLIKSLLNRKSLNRKRPLANPEGAEA